MNTVQPNAEKFDRGALIVNADDWGSSRRTTDAIWECLKQRAVSSASAMVFMEDSERAAELARNHGIDIGLHLNLTTAFTADRIAPKLAEQQRRTVAYLRSSRIAQTIVNPLLCRAFDYVVKAQLDEFERLYGHHAYRIDGHHHMHLCANVLWGRLLPSGVIVRRSFSFNSGEKSIFNRYYRHLIDLALSRHHYLTDFFFSIEPVANENRLDRIVSLARSYVIEIETHPVNLEEYVFLTGSGFRDLLGSNRIADHFGPVANRFPFQ